MMSAKHVTPEWFAKLNRSDFENGAVISELRKAIQEHAKMLEQIKTDHQMEYESSACPDCGGCTEDDPCLFLSRRALIAKVEDGDCNSEDCCEVATCSICWPEQVFPVCDSCAERAIGIGAEYGITVYREPLEEKDDD